MEQFNASEHRTCRALSQSRSTQHYRSQTRDGEEYLVEWMIELASNCDRYRHRRTTALLQREGWKVNHNRVERLWLNDGSCIPDPTPVQRSFMEL